MPWSSSARSSTLAALTESPIDDAPAAAVDNDVLIKAAAYALIEQFWPAKSIGVLGAARYVVTGRIARMDLAGDPATARQAALELINDATVLEPSKDELRLATRVETIAQRRGLSLDAGESQLAAIIVMRGIPLLETGDKRAIRAFEALLDELEDLAELRGKLRSLEQIVLRCADAGDPSALATAICSEPHVDKALSICCRCFSPPSHGPAFDRAGLESYIHVLRVAAPRVLEP